MRAAQSGVRNDARGVQNDVRHAARGAQSDAKSGATVPPKRKSSILKADTRLRPSLQSTSADPPCQRQHGGDSRDVRHHPHDAGIITRRTTTNTMVRQRSQ